jgi:hypothetical protein
MKQSKNTKRIFQFKMNEGKEDRIIRSFIAIGLFVAAYFSTGNAQLFFLIFGTTMTITTIFGWCPLYILFGFDTCRDRKKAKK